MDWWRSWHGAPTDLKWPVVAKRATEILARDGTCDARYVTSVTSVTAVTWVLLDYASQNNIRGSVAGFDVEGYAHWAGMLEAEVKAILEALHDKNVLKDNAFVNWSKRQESGAAERMRKMREKRKAELVTPVTLRASHVPRGDKIRDSNIPPISPARAEVRVEYSPRFEKLWSVWRPFEMTKGNKAQASKSFEKIMASGVPENVLGMAAEDYCETCHKRQVKTQHLVTWLNQRGWESVEAPAKKNFYDNPMNRMPSPAGG